MRADLLEGPSHPFVGYFIGSPGMNLIEVERCDGGVRFAHTVLPLSPALNQRLDQQQWTSLKVGIRPEFVHVWEGPNADALCGDVVHLEDLGTYKILTLRLDGQLLKVRLQEDQPVPQQQVYLSFPAQWLMLYADEYLVDEAPAQSLSQPSEVQP